jgi:hypothetical protein
MTEPLPLDTVLSEFSEDTVAWVLQARTGKYLTIPDSRYPGRHPVRFFMSKQDAERVLARVLAANSTLAGGQMTPQRVKLLAALRGIASDRTPGNADSFVVHSPNEVYEFGSTRVP